MLPGERARWEEAALPVAAAVLRERERERLRRAGSWPGGDPRLPSSFSPQNTPGEGEGSEGGAPRPHGPGGGGGRREAGPRGVALSPGRWPGAAAGLPGRGPWAGRAGGRAGRVWGTPLPRGDAPGPPDHEASCFGRCRCSRSRETGSINHPPLASSLFLPGSGPTRPRSFLQAPASRTDWTRLAQSTFFYAFPPPPFFPPLTSYFHQVLLQLRLSWLCRWRVFVFFLEGGLPHRSGKWPQNERPGTRCQTSKLPNLPVVGLHPSHPLELASASPC